MAVELAPTAGGWRTWKFSCDLCDRTLWSALSREPVATDMARSHGWITERTTLCPACAAVTQKLDQTPRAEGTDRPCAG